ncbi:hypothetical protein PVAG01_00751 [Phlyctema vagabunda]|uniref:Uncharacterized protein n=1 Tax=Phlyctema vagabunda TaxID=108571 RepID=A0ABR4PV44_9HELO
MGQPRSRAKTSNLPDRSPFSDFMGLYDIAARKTKAVLATPDLTSAFSTDSTEPEPRWNFESLKDLPTIQQPVVPLPISQTWIPSPFVPGLYPNHVESIKNRLAGTGDHKYGGSGSGFLECGQGKSLTYSGLSGWTGTGPQALGNGKNIWNAWKRAFDLWNDYYIEGRVDTKEVGKELLAVEKEQIQKRRGQNVDSANPGDASLADSEAEFLKDHPWREHVQTLDDAIRDTGPGIRGIKWVIPEPPFNGVDQDRNWEDPIENTVWMPVVCGETKPMFNWDIHTERLTSDNEHKEYPELDEHALYGGYDCSIMPTPVLRPIERYGFNRSNNERDVLHVHRVRMWDGVSNTVFNIPTKPFSDDSDLVPVDNIVQRAYRSAADELEVEGTPVYFPLNIRRIERLQISKPIDIPHIGLDLEGTANADRLLEKTKSNKLMSLGPSDIPNVSLDDPWYFTPTEQELRRQIDRSVPKHDSFKPQSYDRSLLEYEIKRDVYKYAEYFITNLDGRTLIVNGLEVRRGQVAGPLPKFAIIECPGGNVVFWWGNGGRNKGKDRGRIDYASVHKAWLTKRHEEGDADLDWKTIRRTRRSVWRSLIKVKMEKVANHEEKLDPAWAAWMEQARMEEEGLGLRGTSS